MTPSHLGPQATVCLSWLQNHSALPHGSVFQGSLKDSYPLDPLILLPEIHSKKIIRITSQTLCKDVHCTIHYNRRKNWKPSRCPETGLWSVLLRYNHTTKYYVALKNHVAENYLRTRAGNAREVVTEGKIPRIHTCKHTYTQEMQTYENVLKEMPQKVSSGSNLWHNRPFLVSL